MAKLTDDEIQTVAVESLRNAMGGPESDVGRLRLRNIIAYNGLAEGDFAPPEVEDRSDFVDTTVADTVNTTADTSRPQPAMNPQLAPKIRPTQ